MSEGSRPGGLTALAVLNFIGGAYSLLTAFGAIGLLLVYSGAIELPESDRRGPVAVVDALGERAWQVQAVSAAASAILLIASGVGYLRQSRFWGRTLGNAYSLISIAMSVVFLMSVREGAGAGVDLGFVLWVIYPVLTLYLVNRTFREDFVR